MFEGLDRSGKTTTLAALYERLKGVYPVEKLSFPDRKTPIGQLIDKYLRKEIALEDETIHMLFSCDRYEHRKHIEELRSRAIVLCDRYSMSGVVFSAFKGLDLEWCYSTEQNLPKPDLTVYMDIDIETIQKRNGFGDEVYEKIEVQERVAQYYKQLMGKQDNVLVVDGCKPTSEIVDIIMERIFR